MRPLIIAELSANHGGDIRLAEKMIAAAAEAGADAVKLQTYLPDTMTIDHDGPGFIIDKGLWKGRKLYDLYQQAHTPWEWHEQLFSYAADIGIAMFSSPFDVTAVDFLETLNCPAYKIASFELVDIELLRKVAATGKPVVLSTGMASLGEIETAIHEFNGIDNHGRLILLHCTSGYPTPVSEANLKTIHALKECFGIPVGLSDHTQGNAVAIAASALGACIIEKHFTLSRADGGLDAEFSIEPDELKQLVSGCADAADALGLVSFGVSDSEAAHVANRRSLYAISDIQPGEPLTSENIKSIRPGYGLSPRHLPDVLGKCARNLIKRGEPISWDRISN